LLPTISLTGDPIGSLVRMLILVMVLLLVKLILKWLQFVLTFQARMQLIRAGELRVGSKLDNGAYVESTNLLTKMAISHRSLLEQPNLALEAKVGEHST
jgi:hypothetical protein